MECLMGSFQQISIGIVCLVAAFAFGNYVNTHPPGDRSKAVTPTNSDSDSSDGNVQSRLTSGIEFIKKQPAPIATMRAPLQPRFSMPSTNSVPSAPSPADPNPLPPPSQLARNEPNISVGSEPPKTETLLDDLTFPEVTSRTAKASDVPDFSSIMNELEGTPIALQPLNSNPQLIRPKENQSAQAIAKPRRDANAPLKDLASEFKSATLPRESNLANPWNMQPQPAFSADDFSPQLLDGRPVNAVLKSNPPNVEQTREPIMSAPESQLSANANGVIPGRSNHVVSREPIPPESNDEHANGTVLISGVEPITPSIPLSAKLPFGLNEQGRQQLAAIKSRASSQLELNTTRFVDHVVQPGETLQSIAKRYFGDPDYYLDIYLANRSKLRNPVNIETGTALRIPIYD